ncbi:hypothetical protein [Deinococcus hohokamensis]|uniref:Uncharacterized protein n=1 Tax=Deinococcus hohokamensis TaxID=309883 RepID=A0ABV9IBV2_9DEIO
MSLVDWLALVVAGGALVVSMWSAQATKRQADTAARTAMDARRSATAAEQQAQAAAEQLALMQAQWDAAQAAERKRLEPRFAALPMPKTAETYLTLVNQGMYSVHIREVQLKEQFFDFLETRVMSGIPAPGVVIPPDESVTILRAVHKDMDAHGLVVHAMDWSLLRVVFRYGPDGALWEWVADIRTNAYGSMNLRNAFFLPMEEEESPVVTPN